MKEYKFLTKKKRNRLVIFGTVRIKWFGATILKQNFTCMEVPKMDKRCWVAEKKDSAYVLNKKLSNELTTAYKESLKQGQDVSIQSKDKAGTKTMDG